MLIPYLFIVSISIFSWFLLDKQIRLYKKDLRNMFEKEKRKKYNNILQEEFKYIYDNVIQNAKIGETKLNFMIFCKPYRKEPEYNKGSFLFHDQKYKTILNEYKILSSNILSEELQNIYNFSVKSLEFDFLLKLHRVFPDSNLTYHKKDEKKYYNCDYFTLSW